MSKPVHHNKRGKQRNWIITAHYEGFEPFKFGTLRSISDNERDLKLDARKLMHPHLPSGFLIDKVERGRIEIIKEYDE